MRHADAPAEKEVQGCTAVHPVVCILVRETWNVLVEDQRSYR